MLRWPELALLLCLAAGCAGSSLRRVEGDRAEDPTDGQAGASGSPPWTVPLEALPDALADAVCGYEHACGANPYWEGWPGGCRALLTPLFRNTTAAQIEAGISVGTIVYDPARAADCVAKIRDLPCDAEWPRGLECSGGIDGTVPSGGPCSDDLECAGDAYCAEACPGTCVPRGRVGDVCGLGMQCTRGTYCLSSPVDSSRCSPLNGEGESCNGLCRGALACKLTPGAQGICQVRQFVGLGESCDTTFAICADDTVCADAANDDDIGQSVCVLRVASGAACRFSTPGMCPDGETCSLPGGAGAEGTCVPTGAPGDLCEPRACEIGSTCEGGRCQGPRENGEPCDSNGQCWSYRCLDGLCTVPACGEGETFPEQS